MKNPFGDNFDFSDFFVAPHTDSSGSLGGTPPPPSVLGAPIIVPDEELKAEAAVAVSGSGGPGSVVTVSGATSAGLTINLVFDAAAMAAPQSFRDGITAAMQMICAVVTDHVTLNFQIDYSGTGRGAFAGPSGGNYVGYSTVRADLVNNASPGDTTFNSLPTGSTIAGQSSVAVWYSQEKLWGLISPTGAEIDGSASFATDISPSLLVGVALHELTHAMGRVPYAGSTGQPDIFDFDRFTSAGNILISGSNTAPPAYFSLNNGASKIADYGQTSDPSDFLNSGVQGSTDPFNEFYGNSTQQQLTATDLMQLDALGFHLLSNQQTTTVIDAVGSTELVQVGTTYFLDPAAGGTGPSVKDGGVAVTAGSFAGWAAIGAEPLSGGGYEIAWFNAGTNQYSVWTADSNGNFTGNLYSPGPGNAAAFEALETSFQQDLNHDGTIGAPAVPVVIEAFGSTELVQTGTTYFLDPSTGGTGPSVKYGGVVVTAGSFAGWVAIGAEPLSGGGYEIAWHNAGTGQYSVWTTDSNGNFTGNLFLPGSDNAALQALETSFHQDLDGDGTIGVSSAGFAIEVAGATELIQSSHTYFLDPAAGGTGVSVKYQGVAVSAGSFASWVAIGAEPLSGGGYEIAWHNVATDQYSVWTADSNGNFTGNLYLPGPGTSTAFEALEPSFQQDLNGDHTIGVPAHTSPAAQVANAAPAAQATPSLGGGDSFAFRPDLGSLGGDNAPPPAASPAAGEMLTLTTPSAAVAHIDTVDVHDLAGAHDGAVQGAVFDPLHGFMIH
jgi:serralysin